MKSDPFDSQRCRKKADTGEDEACGLGPERPKKETKRVSKVHERPVGQ